MSLFEMIIRSIRDILIKCTFHMLCVILCLSLFVCLFVFFFPMISSIMKHFKTRTFF